MRGSLIGCGVMGSAFVRAVRKPINWFLVGRRVEDTHELSKGVGGTGMARISELLEISNLDFIVVAVKPKDLEGLCQQLKDVPKSVLIISLVAGTPLSRWEELLPKQPICRLLPNLAIQIGEGVIGMAEDPSLSPSHRELVYELIAPMGLVQELDEKKLEALSALAGSGPGFAFLILEAFIEASIGMGLKPAEATAMACQTLKGAGQMCMESQLHPAELKWNVAAPGGSTIQGLRSMEQAGVRSGIIEGILETYHFFRQP